MLSFKPPVSAICSLKKPDRLFPGESASLQVVLKNKPEEKRKLLAALQAFAREHELPANVLQAADLALEEHLTNLMNYAYADDLSHEIIVRFDVHQDALALEV